MTTVARIVSAAAATVLGAGITLVAAPTHATVMTDAGQVACAGIDSSYAETGDGWTCTFQVVDPSWAYPVDSVCLVDVDYFGDIPGCAAREGGPVDTSSYLPMLAAACSGTISLETSGEYALEFRCTYPA